MRRTIHGARTRGGSVAKLTHNTKVFGIMGGLAPMRNIRASTHVGYRVGDARMHQDIPLDPKRGLAYMMGQNPMGKYMLSSNPQCAGGIGRMALVSSRGAYTTPTRGKVMNPRQTFFGMSATTGLQQLIQKLIESGWTDPSQANFSPLISDDKVGIANIGSYGDYTPLPADTLSCSNNPKCSIGDPGQYGPSSKCTYNDDGTFTGQACPLAVPQIPASSTCGSKCYMVMIDNTINGYCPTCTPSTNAILVRPCDGPAGSTFEGDMSVHSSIRQLCPYTYTLKTRNPITGATKWIPMCSGSGTTHLPPSVGDAEAIISSRTGGPQLIRFIEADCITGIPKF